MAGAVSALFLLDIKGRVLVWRDYRGDVSAVQAERFFTKLIEKEVCSSLPFRIRFLNLRSDICQKKNDQRSVWSKLLKVYISLDQTLIPVRSDASTEGSHI